MFNLTEEQLITVFFAASGVIVGLMICILLWISNIRSNVKQKRRKERDLMKVKNPYGSRHELNNKPENLADLKKVPIPLDELAKALIKHDPDGSKALAIAKKYRA